METHQPNKAVVILIVVVLLGLTASGVVYVVKGKDDSDTSQHSMIAVTSSQTGNSGSKNSSATYKDGHYNATGNYVSPGGDEQVDIAITLKSNIITAAGVTTQPASSTSSQYQSEFIDNFKPLVVGKSINDVQLDRVAGSSLTSNGFNDALAKIKTEAAK